MDVETSEAIDALRHELRSTFATKAELKEEIGGVRADIQTVGSDLRGEMQSVRADVQSMQTDMQLMRADMQAMRTDMQAMRTELRQHTDVVFESVRDDIRIVAEGLAALGVKVDKLASSRR